MSIYAKNYVVDEETGEVKLIKHLNQRRIDRNYTWGASGGWNKNGRKARKKRLYKSFQIELSKANF